MNPLAIGLIVNSALYLVCIFVAALVRGNTPAMVAAILTMGVCYLSYGAQIMVPLAYGLNHTLFVFSVIGGVAAGLLLVIG